MDSRSKTVKDMYVSYANKKLGTKYKSIITLKKKMIEKGYLTNTEFYFIVQSFFERATDKIILGKSLLLPDIGYIFIEKKPRIEGTKKVDWKASNDYKKELIEKEIELYNHETGEGEKWLHFLQDNYYLRYNLKRAKNKRINKYIFKPTYSNFNTGKTNKDGTKQTTILGTKGKLVKANNNNPLLHLIYVGKANNIK